MDLSTLRQDTEALVLRLENDRYRYLGGLSRSTNLAAIFQEAREVATPDAVGLAREALAKAEGRRAVRLGHLADCLEDLVARAATAAAEDELSRRRNDPVSGAPQGESPPLHLALAR